MTEPTEPTPTDVLRLHEDHPCVERAAKALCKVAGFSPKHRDPGNVTVPWNAKYIGEDNIRWDGQTGRKGDTYRENWVFMWRRYIPQAMIALTAAADELDRLRAATAWQPISTAPRDGTRVLVYAPAYQDLPPITCECAWHDDAGWCVDELRNPTHWQPIPPPPETAP